MVVNSDKINIYVEGIKIPAIDFEVGFQRNSLTNVYVTIPIGDVLDATMWAGALLQVTYFEDSDTGFKKEKLLYQGWVSDLDVNEAGSTMGLNVSSCFSSFNNNRTLDYTSPKRYGLHNIEDGVVLYLGNEDKAVLDFANFAPSSYKLSERFMYIDPNKISTIDDLNINDPEAMKLQFIIDKTPFAERFAFSLFEDIAYGEFMLTRIPVSRLNLLAKSNKKTERTKLAKEELAKALEINLGLTELDNEFTGLAHKDEVENNRIPLDPTTAIGQSGADITIKSNIESNMSSGKLIFDKPNDAAGAPKGVVKRKDGADVVINPRLLALLNVIAQNFGPITVSSLIGGHSKNVAGTTRESQHWSGNAVDISTIKGEVCSSNSTAAGELLKFLYDNFDEFNKQGIPIRQTIGPIKYKSILIARGSKTEGVYVSGHENHVHIGVSAI